MRKNVIIFFPNHHLAYSPTTINLYKSLENLFNVKIIAPYPSKFNNKVLTGFNVEYFYDLPAPLLIKVKALILVFFKNISSLIFRNKIVYKYHILKALLKYDSIFKNTSKQSKDDIIIAFDILFFKIAVKYFKKVNFVSLELMDDLIPLLRTISENQIESVIIQSKERYDYLFQNKQLKVFYVQNSTFYTSTKQLKSKIDNTLIFNGTPSQSFGIFYFLDFIQSNNLFTGIVKGALSNEIREEIKRRYPALLNGSKLILDDNYLDGDHLIDYVSAYQIGVCFYDIKSFSKNKFNYLSAPSGKMFTYFASGVPIIGSNIPGLKIIEEFEAGILIDKHTPDHILSAINRIKEDYGKYSENCFKAAGYFSFDKQVKPFVEYLSL